MSLIQDQYEWVCSCCLTNDTTSKEEGQYRQNQHPNYNPQIIHQVQIPKNHQDKTSNFSPLQHSYENRNKSNASGTIRQISFGQNPSTISNMNNAPWQFSKKVQSPLRKTQTININYSKQQYPQITQNKDSNSKLPQSNRNIQQNGINKYSPIPIPNLKQMNYVGPKTDDTSLEGSEKPQPNKIVSPQRYLPSKDPNYANKEKVVAKQALNDKFENSVRGSQIGDVIFLNQFTDPLGISACGLPNVGNTCYLNSILQMLFSAEKLRKMIVKLSAKPNLVFHRLIANVFEDIANKQSMQQKRKDLLQLVGFIEKNDPKFARFQQNNAIQCFLAVLNLLEEEDSSNSKLNYFKIKYQPRCKCTKTGFHFLLQNFYVSSEQFCITCEQRIQFCILNSGPYIVVMPNHQNFKVRQMIKFINKDNNQLFFENRSFLTQSSEHYIAYRNTQNGWVEICDDSVSLIELQTVKNTPIITLYGFKKRKPIQ